MGHKQVTERERYIISLALRKGASKTSIAHELKRSRSTIQREIARNRDRRGHYKPLIAHDKAEYRKRSSRRKSYFTEEEWKAVYAKIREEWAPEQASGRLADEGKVFMHLSTIYREIGRDKRKGGRLHKHLRQANKKRRKRYGRPDSRGVLPGKRNIAERPKAATKRLEPGHWEIDLVRGHRGEGWLLTLLERMTRLVRIRKLGGKSVEDVNRQLIPLVKTMGIKTITADNGTEFHGFKQVEEETGVRFYFANAHRSWERGSIENMNGLIRQYLPKKMPLLNLIQAKCDFIEGRLNGRPRKILGFKTPEECYYGL